MTLIEYVEIVNRDFKSGNSTELTYRGYLQQLVESICSDVIAKNEPKKQYCGKPDYIIQKKAYGIPIGFIEAKDIGDKDLRGLKQNKEQFDRYKGTCDPYIFTDYTNFLFYNDNKFVTEIRIAEVIQGGIIAIPHNFTAFENLIKDFCSTVGQTIKNAEELAKMMAGKARMLSDVIEKSLDNDSENENDSTLKAQLVDFRKILIHDITNKGFADVYAQTISYGMFAARLHDPTLPTFSKNEAAELIPKSNPFLRKLFGYIAGPDLDDRIEFIVVGLVNIFNRCNVSEILKNYGKSTKMEDPIIHFYETFLKEYDPKLRKARGVWYTPQPVVNFIVRAVDDILKEEFGLPSGLADTSKMKIQVNQQGVKIEKEVHKVQILDPATGTGTFLAETIKHIHKKFEGQQGIWSKYVETHLLPRLNGFELLMASYAMAHLKLDLLLTETGYKPTTNQRFRVYLTNSLEEHHQDTGTLFANWLSTEANEANHIKRDTPVMCVIGNPPYAVSSTNKNEWIEKLISDYKKDLNEKSYNSLSDDYVKFIRYGQYNIDKNGSGILAYISNNSFIDGTVHRKMRKNLLESFDKIYILDLHGNAKKKEISLDGSADQNVFDIMQGVSINIFIKTGKKKKTELGIVQHFDLQGKREFKYDFLNENHLDRIKWNNIKCLEPQYYFTNKDFEEIKNYEKGFLITDLMKNLNPGVESGRDDFFIGFNKNNLKIKIEEVLNNKSSNELKTKYGINDTDSFKFESNLQSSTFDENCFEKISYRPFDLRYTYYDIKLQRRPSFETFKHIIKGSLGLVIKRGFDEINSAPVFILNAISDRRGWSRAGMQGAESISPLYLYPETKGQQTIDQSTERTPNLNTEIVKQIAKKLDLTFTTEKETAKNTFAPIDILDYIYAVLHSRKYRETYKEFLKIDFPRVPYPKDKVIFWQLAKLGAEIRQIHLLESPIVEKYITQYPEDGNNVVVKPKYENGKVYINDTQYFDNVPQIAWDFFIGGYQPAQKWLKDRKERTLEFDDILHYQKIIVALVETNRLMIEIDKIELFQN